MNPRPETDGKLPRFVSRLLFVYWRLVRGMTLGVRAVVLDDKDRVLLLRHTYIKGWHFPGGGVDGGETFRAAVERELMEETGMVLTGEPVLHGVFRNAHASSRDHVAVYVVRAFRLGQVRKPDREIAEFGFFRLDALPEGTTRGTQERLREIAQGLAPALDW